MKKATRALLQQKTGAKHVPVRWVDVDGTLVKHCFENALKLVKTDEENLMVVSGWMVGEYYGERGTPISPHYWVLNKKTNEYLDPTPWPNGVPLDVEYVDDVDIMIFASKQSIIPLSLNYTNDGKFKARSHDGTRYIELDKINVEQLYQLQKT